MKLSLIFALFLALPTAAQSVSLNFGDSTLYGGGNTLGGGLTFYTPASETTVSLGEFNNRLLPGVTYHRSIHDWNTKIGNQNLSLNADGGSLNLPCICVTTQPTWRWASDVTLFAGLSGQFNYFSPFAFAQPAPFHLGLGFSLHRQITPFFELETLGLVAGREKSAVEAIRFLPNEMSGLKGLKQHVSISATIGWINGYPIRNGMASVSGKQAGGSFSRSTFVLPQGTFTSQTESGFVAARGFQLSGGMFQGNFRGKTAGLNWNSESGKLRAGANYYQSDFGSTISYLLAERIRKFTLIETASHSANGWVAQPGFGYLGNKFNIQINPSEVFNPQNGRWVRTFSVSLSMNQLPRDSSISIQTITLPGRLGYTAFADSWLYGRGRAADNQPKIGKYLLSGSVTDGKSNPVEGAAIDIENTVVYSDADGNFELFVNKARPYRLRVITDDFLLGTWEIVKAPQEIVPDQPIEITVQPSYGIPMPSR